jgi:hypothetical protein
MTCKPRRLIDMTRAFALAAAGLVLCAAAGMARAQDTDPGTDVDVDPPSRAARISEVNGQVWLYSVDTGEWVTADLNRPLTTGDRLATDPGARAEIQLGSTTVRLDSSTELEVSQLDDEHFALDLQDGSVIANVRDPAEAGQFELTTDEGRFLTERAGVFRFDRVDAKSDGTVYSGQLRYEGPNSALPIQAGQRAQFWIDSGGVAQYVLLQPASDAFASWSGSRDRQVVAAPTVQRYVSPEMTGAEDLDRYGRWEQNPDYGPVWIPTAVAADWAPYSHGHWTWVRPWGWTWVDDAPWGFAPFHYGRWVYARNNWCWTPGTRVRRPVYAPALVAWIGGPRANVSVTVGGGPGVGWFPLAPREVYVPGYRASPRYTRNLNITNVTNVTVINNVINNPRRPREFENRRFPRAITVVPEGVMRDRKPVAPAAAQYRQTPWVRDLTNQPGRAVAVTNAPPVAGPALPPRGSDPRGVRPPPGVAERPGMTARPGFPPSGNRAETDRRTGSRDRDRFVPPPPGGRPQMGGGQGPQSPQIAQPQPQQPQQPQSPQTQRPPLPGAAVVNPGVQRPPSDAPEFGDRGPNQRPGMPPRGPGSRDPNDRPNDRGLNDRGGVERGPIERGPSRVGNATAPAVQAPVQSAQPQVAPAAPQIAAPQRPATPQQQAAPQAPQPDMRALPVHRDRDGDRRGEERRPEQPQRGFIRPQPDNAGGRPQETRPQEIRQQPQPVRPQQEARPPEVRQQAQPQAQPQMRVERPASPPPPRAPEVQRVAPPAAPAAPAEPRRGGDPRGQAEAQKADQPRRGGGDQR